MGFKRKEENITVFGKRRSIARQGVLQGTGGFSNGVLESTVRQENMQHRFEGYL